jgi:plasmid stabilization system protein ParE
MNLLWTAFAAEQLDDIYNFLKDKSENAAINVYNDILDEVDILRNFPRIAQVEPLLLEYPEMYRSLIVRRTYKVVYYFDEETVYIVAVFDCRQNPEKLKKNINR